MQPEPAPIWLHLWNLKPFPPPDALDPRHVRRPTSHTPQRRDALVVMGRPNCEPSAMMAVVSASSSTRPCGIFSCVDRCCPSTREANRSEIRNLCLRCCMRRRRRAGLRSFPVQPQLVSAAQAPVHGRLSEAAASPLGSNLWRLTGHRPYR